MKTRRDFLRLAGIGAASVATFPRFGKAAAAVSQDLEKVRPNIVFILADDLGWSDSTLYGSTFYETPNIDRLAQRGMFFTQAYAAYPVCSPTRASILSGQYPARLGFFQAEAHVAGVKLAAEPYKKSGPDQKVISAQSATRLDTKVYTLAEALQAGGYSTGHFGKWHVGLAPYDALHQGFQVDIPHKPALPGPGSYLVPWVGWPEGEGKPGEHIEDRMAQEAVRFLEAQKGKPFFLNYWCFSVHSPWQGKPEYVEKYKAKAAKLPKDARQRHPIYGAMVQAMDDAVGTLVNALDRLGLAQNTIVVFFSDNGGVNHRNKNSGDTEVPITSNAPLRGGKASVWEGGLREPCVVVWPGKIKPGVKSDAMFCSVDFYPTLLSMCGLPVPNLPEQPLDGLSQVPVLLGGAAVRDSIFCHAPVYWPGGEIPSTTLRLGNFKLIRRWYDGPDFVHRHELYNLESDVGETTDLSVAHPEKVFALAARMDELLAQTKAYLPTRNPGYVAGAPAAETIGKKRRP